VLPLKDGHFMRCIHCGPATGASTGMTVCRICFLRHRGVGVTDVTSMLNAAEQERHKHVHCFVEARPPPTAWR
jgi:hypothetical protein